MVQYQQIDRTFAALADPTRRAILQRLGRGSASVSELAEPFGMSLTGMTKHLGVLQDVELVTATSRSPLATPSGSATLPRPAPTTCGTSGRGSRRRSSALAAPSSRPGPSPATATSPSPPET